MVSVSRKQSWHYLKTVALNIITIMVKNSNLTQHCYDKINMYLYIKRSKFKTSFYYLVFDIDRIQIFF